MTHENGGTPIAFGLLMEDVTGQVVAPDRLKADIGAWAGGFFFDVSLIAIGEETWLTNPFTDEFELIERGIVSSALLDPATGISGIIRDAKDPVLEGETSLDGISYLPPHLDHRLRAADLHIPHRRIRLPHPRRHLGRPETTPLSTKSTCSAPCPPTRIQTSPGPSSPQTSISPPKSNPLLSALILDQCPPMRLLSNHARQGKDKGLISPLP